MGYETDSKPYRLWNTETNKVFISRDVKFNEENWQLPALGNGASDTTSGTIDSMFDFHGDGGEGFPFFLNPRTGLRQAKP